MVSQDPIVSFHRAAIATSLLLFTLPAAAQCTEGCTALITLEGENAGDQFGWVSNDIGDVNGDGVHDFVITAPTHDGVGNNSGRIYVYSGIDGAELFQVSGAFVGGAFGHDANKAGDVNGDGVPDVIVGEPGSGTGHAYVYSGIDGALLMTFDGEAAADGFGYRVDGGGDFNGDGTPDLLIGARHHDTNGPNSGRAYVFSGVDGAELCVFDGDAAGDRFGSGVAFVGDINHDGKDDIAVGAQDAGSGSGGIAYVFSIGSPFNPCQRIRTLVPGEAATDFGLWFMNGGHDVDNDGTPDIYVNDYQRNRAHIYSGATGDKLWALSGNGNGQFGIGRLVEDIDGDCHADMILAAWISSEGASNAGKAFIYSGRTGEVLETFTHNVAGAGFGFDANGQGDANGDGAYDWLVTAASDNGGRGTVYVLAGNIEPPAPGDVNGDMVVDTDDLLALLASWGDCPQPPAACASDFDCNGTVDVGDLLTLLSQWTI